MPEVTVTWGNGVWLLEHDGLSQRAPKRDLLDAWLAMRGASRVDLKFPTQSLRERFIHEFGPLVGPAAE